MRKCQKKLPKNGCLHKMPFFGQCFEDISDCMHHRMNKSVDSESKKSDLSNDPHKPHMSHKKIFPADYGGHQHHGVMGQYWNLTD